MEQRILVLGGTGLLGAPVARRLLADGFRVRVLTRDPGKARRMFEPPVEIAPGDATDSEDLRRALDECRGAHVSIAGPSEPAVAEAVAALAPEVGLERIGYVSGSTVDERNRWFPMVAGKLRGERALEESGVPWTILRPTWPFETLARFVRGGRATMIGKLPTPYHWFAADDFARMVSTAYRIDDAVGKRFFIHGPQPIAMREALDRYREALHPEISSVSTLPIWMARLLAAVTRNEVLKFASDLMAYFDRAGEPGDPAEANRILGAPMTTLDEWLATRGASREIVESREA